jgi:hypothetical protein
MPSAVGSGRWTRPSVVLTLTRAVPMPCWILPLTTDGTFWGVAPDPW